MERGKGINYVVAAKVLDTVHKNTRCVHMCIVVSVVPLDPLFLINLQSGLISDFQALHWRLGHKTECQQLRTVIETSESGRVNNGVALTQKQKG